MQNSENMIKKSQDPVLYCDDRFKKIDEQFRDWILEIDLQVEDYVKQLNHQ
ncbi:MAG: hypothetical protein Hyperionvirus4_74 [Hyperionvirus sp.]|uniref:Uncharacterized protein n=1 Tax=Hyperionvirus sp. TaxID=2487770 RepID=A0A3G5ACP4_9VIRU|nr:MAG: hypothetical protein Hyperionvirus4_74 [Hyperionvirus sp.]